MSSKFEQARQFLNDLPESAEKTEALNLLAATEAQEAVQLQAEAQTKPVAMPSEFEQERQFLNALAESADKTEALSLLAQVEAAMRLQAQAPGQFVPMPSEFEHARQFLNALPASAQKTEELRFLDELEQANQGAAQALHTIDVTTPPPRKHRHNWMLKGFIVLLAIAALYIGIDNI